MQNILSTDPILEMLRSGNFSLKDMRALASCVEGFEGCEDVVQILHSLARGSLHRGTRALIALSQATKVLHTRMRGLTWDIETRLSESGVPTKAIHPSLISPLCRSGFVAPAVLYGDISGLVHSVRLISHPCAWTAAGRRLWDAVAASASLTMRPCLIFILSLVLPIEARLAYLTIRHSAYAAPGVETLGDLVGRIVSNMMTQDLSPKDLPKVAKSLRQVAPTLEPLSLYVMRVCRKGGERTNGQRGADRAALETSLAAFFEDAGDAVLYSQGVWVTWLLAQEERALVALYVKYLCDGFQ